MGLLARITAAFLLASSLSASPTPAGPTAPTGKLPLQLNGQRGFGGPYHLSVGLRGELFVLDRGSALLYRISPADGAVMWRIDGSESGQPFIDPASLSRPDGFFINLTDRGSRKIWRIYYRGEVRGSLDLSFAADPVMLELTGGSQMVLYDRASSKLYLLDDSGRPLWSFPVGAGRNTAEPRDMSVSADGGTLYLLWADPPGITTVNLFGRNSSEIPLELPEARPALLAATTDSSGRQLLCLADPGGAAFTLEPLSGTLAGLPLELGQVWDIRARPGQPGKILILSGPEPSVLEIELEMGE
ncbi:MAG: hypothetical protein A3F83_07635 [Candidatus Glassbacteria bacterium RIFCSPLOWO2_12_FULL_58_11]|uniref:Uncharacterized protein n=1 Tax=Candidatus Glassbacteria bacterium RIFCSPLOWO2_12_FULL_58_11 TaxID=1817867 RepID=A0A1F5YY69_9BACT|nr:MAG: hypothetical protein A3F83_07635 [Candidatus Glassbacteria bacterium RIFCSPLOWO2_12_FULL_58_11]